MASSLTVCLAGWIRAEAGEIRGPPQDVMNKPSAVSPLRT